MSRYSEANIYQKTAVWSSGILLTIFFGTARFFFPCQYGIPFGIFIGGLINVASFLFLGKSNKKSIKSDIVIITIRFALLVILLICFALLEKLANITIINLFAYLIGYFIPTIVFIVFSLIMKGYETNV